jgi:uncharacterized protein
MISSAIVLLSILMVITGAVGAITGGNSLINVPIMITMGMSTRHAVATNMFSVGFMTVSATVRFARGGLIKKDLLWPLGIITAITSALGALIAVKLPESVVKAVVGVSMGALVLFMIFRKKSTQVVAVTPTRKMAGFAIATVLGVYGGFFSGGYTTLMTVLCTVAFGLTMMQSVAITKPVNLVSCVAACVVFFAGGLIDLRIGIPLAAANLVGGWIGAHTALKQGDKFVRILFLASVAALAVKLLVWDVLLKA